jgi:hypothetical protein
MTTAAYMNICIKSRASSIGSGVLDKIELVMYDGILFYSILFYSDNIGQFTLGHICGTGYDLSRKKIDICWFCWTNGSLLWLKSLAEYTVLLLYLVSLWRSRNIFPILWACSTYWRCFQLFPDKIYVRRPDVRPENGSCRDRMWDLALEAKTKQINSKGMLFTNLPPIFAP